LQLAFTMTINKAQGQTMKIVGIYLPKHVFTHGQLYVVLSWATHVNDVSIFCPNGRTMTNVIYTELLRWFLFFISCLLSFLNGSKFPHPNHRLKFFTLDEKWLQWKLRSQCAVVENKMLPKFLLSHRTKIVPTLVNSSQGPINPFSWSYYQWKCSRICTLEKNCMM
jgi:hypothetical protein